MFQNSCNRNTLFVKKVDSIEINRLVSEEFNVNKVLREIERCKNTRKSVQICKV